MRPTPRPPHKPEFWLASAIALQLQAEGFNITPAEVTERLRPDAFLQGQTRVPVYAPAALKALRHMIGGGR